MLKSRFGFRTQPHDFSWFRRPIMPALSSTSSVVRRSILREMNVSPAGLAAWLVGSRREIMRPQEIAYGSAIYHWSRCRAELGCVHGNDA